MQKTKRQHMVPRSYLVRFCQDGERLFAFDKGTRKTFPTNVMNIAQERYFYDMLEDLAAKAYPDQNVDIQFVEKSFAQMEGVANELLGDILESVDREGGITRNQRLSLAPYIVI